MRGSGGGQQAAAAAVEVQARRSAAQRFRGNGDGATTEVFADATNLVGCKYQDSGQTVDTITALATVAAATAAAALTAYRGRGRGTQAGGDSGGWHIVATATANTVVVETASNAPWR